MKKIVFILICLFNISYSFSNEVSVRLEPREPVAGETFQLVFDIEMQEPGEPFISFEPGQAEVLGRRSLGSSVQTTIINGQVSTKRSIRYAYDLVVPNPGILRISGITVEASGLQKRIDGITANIVREKRAPDAYFLRAEVEKVDVYVGEGLTLNYYLYFRVPIVGTEVRDFPKLNNLIKRFHLPSERIETIEVDGVLYRRQVAYSARIYPEKAGKLVIDPLKLRIQYSDQPTAGSPFSGFGFQSRQTQVRNVQSELLDINVMPLPMEGLPKNFTGLVGKHDFKLLMPRSRFLVNEPVEVKLEVIGGGALENMSAPIIFESDALEQFDTMSEFSEIDRERAKKNFEYTFLARAQLDLPNSTISMNYFDPETKTYVDVPIDIPEIKVSGGALAVMETGKSDGKLSQSPQSVAKMPVRFNITAPIFEELAIYHLGAKFFWLCNLALGGISLLLLGGSALGFVGSLRHVYVGEEIVKEMKRGGISYSRFYRLMDLYNENNHFKNEGLRSVISNLKLSEGARQYFLQVHEQLEKSSFDERKSPINFSFNKRYFHELLKTLNRDNFENH